MIRWILDAYQSLLTGVMTFMFAVLTVVVSYQVLSRYVGSIPRYLWTEEVSRFSFIWMLFLGAAIAVRAKSHFTIDLLPERVSPKVKQIWDSAVLLLMLLIAAYMVIGGIRFFEIGLRRISTTSGIQLAWIYLSIPVSGASMAIFILEQLWDNLRSIFWRANYTVKQHNSTRSSEPEEEV